MGPCFSQSRLGTAPQQLHGLAFLALSQLREPPEGSWCVPMAGPGAPPDLVISVQPSRVGEVLAVLAGPGMLDLREHPRVRGGLRGSGRLHRPEVLHTVRKHFQLLAFWKGRPAESSVRSKYASTFLIGRLAPPSAGAVGALAESGLGRVTCRKGRGSGFVD